MNSKKQISEKKKDSTKKKSTKSASKTPSIESIIKKMINLCNKKNLSFKDQMRIDMYEKTVKVMLQNEKINPKQDEGNLQKENDAKLDLLNALQNRQVTTLPTLEDENSEVKQNE